MHTTKHNHMINLNLLPSNNAIIVDAGACIGDTITELYNINNNSHIYAIEPNFSNLIELEEKCPYIKQIFKGVLVGESSYQIQKDFFEFKGLKEWGNITNINTHTDHAALKKIIKYKVNALNINNLFYTFNIKKIDYFKLDVEASEIDIFNTIKEEFLTKIHQISFEVHLPYVKVEDIKKIVNKFQNLNFEIKTNNEEELYIRNLSFV